MKPSSIRYYFKEGFSSLLRNRLMTVASILTVAACILIITFSYCMISNLNYILEQIENQIGIVVFVEDDISADDLKDLNNKIEKIEHVTEVNYKTPDEALEELKEEWNAEGILDGFDHENNPLSNAFEISLDDIENQDAVLKTLEGMDGIRNIRNAQTETDILLKLNSGVKIVGGIVILALVAISIVIIMNTIKISVFTRRTEISIMKYVGATDWFIRWPFIIEGILIGIIGALLPLILSWPVYSQAVRMLYTSFPMIRNIVTFRLGIDVFSVLIPICLFAGTGIGVIGSVTSMRKYLKV
ncbi:MAG: permease-like cell division protein FtsX [Clostridiales bacterium]|nr:permease-like cell division protein FtsX [Clostridiales bacterium]